MSGFLGDLIDDAFSLPGKVVENVLGLPADLVVAARKAGCKTEEEIRKFCAEMEDRLI